MTKNLFLSFFGITSKDTFFSNNILLKTRKDDEPFACIEITDDGHEILHVGNPLSTRGHVVEIGE